jgi:hypothetical protein
MFLPKQPMQKKNDSTGQRYPSLNLGKMLRYFVMACSFVMLVVKSHDSANKDEANRDDEFPSSDVGLIIVS